MLKNKSRISIFTANSLDLKNLFFTFFCACSFLFTTSITKGQSPAYEVNVPLYEKKNQTIIIKLKEGISPEVLQSAFQTPMLGKASSHKQANLRSHQDPQRPIHKKHLDDIQSSFGLERIYTIEVGADANIDAFVQELESKSFIEYAEPSPRMELLYVPNDPLADPSENVQDNLKVVKAYDAWEIEQGDSTMVIGVLDTGINMNHEDLKGNIYLNAADPINGFDDDGDGYIDNYMGWDFAYNDNDPNDTNGHGTQVAGIAAARTNNGMGIAGIGFNTKFMPIKVFDEHNTFQDGYTAILYAAQKGCKVINLSWGNAGEYSQYAEDIIKTVVLDMDVVVVAAAGNSNKNEEYFPASYEYVLSVANTTKADIKAEGSTFSPYIDLSAPGFNIVTTSGNAYGPSYGTSMAAPAVAGAAALIRARYPQLNALQVMERLRATADDIYHVGNNQQYKELLGKGRLNILRALTDTDAAAIRFREMRYNNDLGLYAFAGDTVTITGQFISYLEAVESLEVILSTSSPYVVLVDSVFHTNNLSTLEAKLATFRVYLKPNLPIGEKLRFRLGYSGSNYEDYQYFDIETNPGYLTIDNGRLAMTISDNGNLCYHVDPHLKGNGIVYTEDNAPVSLLKYASLIISENDIKVLDNMYNSYSTPKREKDFQVVRRIRMEEDDASYVKASSVFTDKSTPLDEGLSISQSLSGYRSSEINQCLFLDYEIINNSQSAIDTLRVGLYTDWDIVETQFNRANYDFNYRLAYAYHPESQTYAGVALLSNQETVYQSVSLYDSNNDFIFGNTISEEEKFSLLLRNDARLETGPANIATVLTAMLYDLKQNGKTTISYVLTAGKSLEALQENIAKALLIRQEFTELPSAFFCPEEDVVVNPGLGNVYFYADSLLTDLLGYGESLNMLDAASDFTLYIKKEKGWFNEKYRIDVHAAQNVVAYFEVDEKERILVNGIVQVAPLNKSTCESYWEWSINDSIVSQEANPMLRFDSPGSYVIKLKVSNDAGMSDSFSLSLYIDKVTGIPENSDSAVEVFPNPASALLHMSLPLGKLTTILLTDQAGKVLIQKETLISSKPYAIHVQDIRPGLYLLQIRTNGQVYVRKILIR